MFYRWHAVSQYLMKQKPCHQHIWANKKGEQPYLESTLCIYFTTAVNITYGFKLKKELWQKFSVKFSWLNSYHNSLLMVTPMKILFYLVTHSRPYPWLLYHLLELFCNLLACSKLLFVGVNLFVFQHGSIPIDAAISNSHWKQR